MAKKATTIQIEQVCKIVREHCSQNEEGVAHYEDGWSDQRVMVEFGHQLTLLQIRKIRTDIMGSTKKPRGPQPEESPVERRLTLIEEYLTQQHPRWRDDALAPPLPLRAVK